MPRHPQHPVLDDIPRFPLTTPLTVPLARALMAAMAPVEPPLAERSLLSLLLWRGGPQVEVSAVGAVVLYTLHDGDAELTAVALPGARLDGIDAATMEEVLTTHTMRFLSEQTAAVLAKPLASVGLRAQHNRDDADYLLSLGTTADTAGGHFKGKRQRSNRFADEHHPDIRAWRLSHPGGIDMVHRAYDRWEDTRYRPGEAIPDAVRYERAGLQHWPTDERVDDILVFGMAVAGIPTAVCVLEPMWSNTWMSVLFKADRSLPGAAEHLRRALAERLGARVGRSALLNVQQDDGIDGLRRSKTSWSQPLRLHEKLEVVS